MGVWAANISKATVDGAAADSRIAKSEGVAAAAAVVSPFVRLYGSESLCGATRMST